MLFLPAALSLGCAIEDGTAFGAPYSIVASPLPRIDGSDVVFTATYSSPCDGGGSEFEVQRFTSEDGEAVPAILQQNLMLVAVRHAPACASPAPFERELTLEIRTPLPASARALRAERMLACPPGSSFDMVKLSSVAPAPTTAAAKDLLGYSAPPSRPADWDEEEDGPWEAEEGAGAPEGTQAQASRSAPLQGGVQGGAWGEELPREDEEAATEDPNPSPSPNPNPNPNPTRALTVTLTVAEQAATEEEEAARVARELATHSAADSVAFLAHCEQMLAQKQAWGCCSSRMVSELRRKVAKERGAGQGEERGEEHNASVEPAGRA